MRESKGGTTAVSESEIIEASLALARTGIYVEPTCAHAAAGFAKLIKDGFIAAAEDTIVILTGTGLKTTSFYTDQIGAD